MSVINDARKFKFDFSAMNESLERNSFQKAVSFVHLP